MPNSITSVLELRNYLVKKINFSLNEKFNFSIQKEVQIAPRFKRDILKIDEDNVAVDLSINIDKEDVPFFIEIEIEGIFKLNQWEENDNRVIIENNAVAILFPYLRSLVTMVTANANFNPYILPVMNISAMFDEANK